MPVYKRGLAATAYLRNVMMEDVEAASASELEPNMSLRQHADWFQGEVERALREADDPTVLRISNEEIKAKWSRQRAELVERCKVRLTSR
jgi:hypothetical protein